MLKQTVRMLTGALVLIPFAITAPVFAQGNYPVKPIRILVGLQPGTGQDAIARFVAKELTESLGQPVVVENRVGASSTIAAAAAAKSTADGYTLLYFTITDTTAVSIFPKLPYDLSRDFAPIIMLSNLPYMIFVHPSLPVKTVKELIALAKAKPGQLSYGSTSTGGGSHLATELFAHMTGIQMLHVPYKGSTSLIGELFAGQLQVVFSTIITMLPHAKAGRVRPIAVTSTTRSGLAPELPTVAESGVPGYAASSWNGLVVQAGTPPPIVTLLNSEVNKVLKSPDTLKLFISQGAEVRGGTPEEFGHFIEAERSKWAKIIKVIGIRPN